MRDILVAIQDAEEGFSKNQRRLAQFITDSYDKAVFMTAVQLGIAVGVSESTVVRFAVELGYEGYPEMQKALQEMVINRLTAAQRIEVTKNRFANQDVLTKVLKLDANRVMHSLDTLDRSEFQASVDAILGAKRIFVMGVRSASTLASFLGYYLNYMFPNVHVVTASGASEMFEQIVSINSDDVLIAYSFPRYSTTTTQGAMYCRNNGATVIGVTDSKASALAQYCDHTLLVKSDMISLVDSLVAPLSVTNALVASLAANREKELSDTFEGLERIWEEFNVYEKWVD